MMDFLLKRNQREMKKTTISAHMEIRIEVGLLNKLDSHEELTD